MERVEQFGGYEDEACNHKDAEEREENEVSDKEDRADCGQAGEAVGCLGEEDGEGACGHCCGEPGPEEFSISDTETAREVYWRH